MEYETNGITSPVIDRVKRREARRKAQRHQRIILTSVGLALAISVGIGIGYSIGSHRNGVDAAENWTQTEIVNLLTAMKAISETEPVPMDSALELWSDDRSRTRIPLLNVPLESETQWEIYSLCGYDDSTFCAVMAIAWAESRFKADAVSDNGDGIGMMQINVRWHTDRMEALGVTDLTDPVQCAAVAIDYIKELEDIFGVGPESPTLYMAYNMGPSGCRSAIQRGVSSTAYSQEAIEAYTAYMAELP